MRLLTSENPRPPGMRPRSSAHNPPPYPDPAHRHFPAAPPRRAAHRPMIRLLAIEIRRHFAVRQSPPRSRLLRSAASSRGDRAGDSISASTISVSANSSSRGRFSTMITRTPSVANMHAYSTPITPPPTTIKVRGICGMPRIWSLLMMLRPLIGTFAIHGRLRARRDDERFRLRAPLTPLSLCHPNVVRIHEACRCRATLQCCCASAGPE